MRTRGTAPPRRRVVLGLFVLLGALIASGAAHLAIEEVRCRSVLSEARTELARGRFDRAGSMLAWVARRRPGDGEAGYRLGVVEWALGQPEGARAAWEGVPLGSAFAARAAVELARVELQRHRLAAAEPLLTRALGEMGVHATEAAETLVHLFKIEGRFREARRLVRERSDRYPDPIALLKEMAQVDSLNPYPFERAREALSLAALAAPADDRVWLGLGNLATRMGGYDEADRGLRRCEASRANDGAVVRGRLGLAVAAGDPARAAQALQRLPTDALGPDEVLRLRAWFAERAGDAEAERRALAGLCDLARDDLRALERLAELAHKSGDIREATRLRGGEGRARRGEGRVSDPALPAGRPGAGRAAGGTGGGPSPSGRGPGPPEAHPRPAPRRPRGDPCPRSRRGHRAASRPARCDARGPASRDSSGSSGRARGRRRPYTGAVAFTDEASAVGLSFTLDNGKTHLHHMPETTCGGVGLLDYDGDGWLDVYCVQGGEFPPPPGAPRDRGGDRLFHNKGDGTFEDATVRSRIAEMPRGYGHGVAIGDYDGDGHPDIFVPRLATWPLWDNQGDGTFREVTEAAGLGGGRDWPTSAAFADVDNDGDLDLYVCHYLGGTPGNPRGLPTLRQGPAVSVLPPQKFPSQPDHLFRNDAGRFVDVTESAGIVDRDGRGLGVVAADFDGDGRVDLFVANDSTANFLFRNLGGMKFEEVARESGVASSADGGYQASMGVACGDLDGDGLMDLARANPTASR